jgi:hypothetical protein
MLGTVRKALASVVIGVAGGAAVAAAAWVLLTLALPAPLPAARAASRAEWWFANYRFSIDVFHAHDRRYEGACLRGWYLRPHFDGPSRRWHGKQNGSLLVLSRGPVVLRGHGRVQLALGHRLPDLPASLAAGIGCTGSVADALGAAAQHGRHLSIERAYAANQPALAIELHLHHERLTVYVTPSTYRPLVLFGDMSGRMATARLYLTPLTRARAAAFRRLLRENRIPLPR